VSSTTVQAEGRGGDRGGGERQQQHPVRAAPPEAAHERADRGEHAFGRAHLRNHQDGREEGDHREQQPHLVQGPLGVHGAHEEHGAGGEEPDQHLDPAGRVHERHRQQDDEGGDGDQVDQRGRHRGRLRRPHDSPRQAWRRARAARRFPGLGGWTRE
jgi:hypothetical protein